MQNDPCQTQMDELRAATNEFSLYGRAGSLAPSLKRVEDVIKPSVVLTAELMEQLKEGKQKADLAHARWMAAIQAVMDCRKNP